jgi:thioredoxin 1
MSTILTDQNFDQEIKKTDKLALVDFFATWCEPCSMLAPILEKMADEFKDKIVLMKANVEETPVNSQKFQVSLIPMVVLFKNGQPINSFTGFKPEAELKSWLEQFIK